MSALTTGTQRDWLARVEINPRTNRVELTSGSGTPMEIVAFTPKGAQRFARGLVLSANLCDEMGAACMMLLVGGNLVRLGAAAARDVASEMEGAAMMAQPSQGSAS